MNQDEDTPMCCPECLCELFYVYEYAGVFCSECGCGIELEVGEEIIINIH